MPNEFYRSGRFLEGDYDYTPDTPGYEYTGPFGEPTWRGRFYGAGAEARPPAGEEYYYGDEAWLMTEQGLPPGPHAGQGPQSFLRDDTRILHEVCRRLTHHGHLDAREIEVDVNDGEVTLRGTVETRRAKRLADDIAESVTGVVDVHNRLRVQPRE